MSAKTECSINNFEFSLHKCNENLSLDHNTPHSLKHHHIINSELNENSKLLIGEPWCKIDLILT